LPSSEAPRYYTERMSTEQIWQTQSNSLEDTLELAAGIGRNLHGGEIIELRSDLGGGKTSFVKGLARGMGFSGNVHSPSFTISNEYKAGDLTLYHFDFYRLTDAGILREELAEVVSDPQAVVVVEWGDIVDDALPQDHITITLEPIGETQRRIVARYSEFQDYIIKNNA
jgi:tRNA threonylcarbamoyladenosine biosynthesis protein TsaE